MNRIFGTVVLGLVATMSELVTVPAEVPFPALDQANGFFTLAPLLKKVSPAVVSITVKVQDAQTQEVGHKRPPGASTIAQPRSRT